MKKTAGRTTVLLAAVLLAGLLLRFHHLGRESLWLDEGASVRLSHHSPAEIVGETAGHFHPPLYFFILRGWVILAGDSAFSVRALSALLGAGSIAVIYLLGSLLFGRRQGLLAALLLCLSKFNLFYSQEARMYSLLGFLTLCSMLFFARMVKKSGFLDFLGYLLSTALLVYTHNFGVFPVVVQNVFMVLMVFTGNRSSLTIPRWLVLQIILLAAYLPWLQVILHQMARMPDSPWSVARPVPETLLYSLLQFSGSEILKWLFIILGLFAIGAALAGRAQEKRAGGKTATTFSVADASALLLLWLALPLLAAFLISQGAVSVFVHRATIVFTFPLYLLVGEGIDSLPGRVLKPAAIAIVAALSLFGIKGYYEKTYRDQWREAVELIARRARGGDIIFCAPRSPCENVFRYYFERTRMPEDKIFIFSLNLDSGQKKELLPPSARPPRIWFLLSHQDIEDWPLIKKKLEKNYEVTLDREFVNGSNVPFHKLRVGLKVCLLEKKIDTDLSRPEDVERFSRLLKTGEIENMLPDPGFEDGGDWRAEKEWLERDIVHGGCRAVHVRADKISDANFWKLRQGPLPLAAGEAYVFGAFVRTSGVKDQVTVEIKEITSLDTHPYFSTGGIGGDNDWTLLIGVFRPQPRAGADVTEIEFRPGRVVDFQEGEFWVDDAFLIPAAQFPGD